MGKLKPTWQRSSRKRASTAARLSTEADPLREVPPELPELPEGEWSERTLDWWAKIWAMPLAALYLRSDLPSLLRLATLIERFEHEPSSGLLEEIVGLEKEFGLTPKSRRLLELEYFRKTSE